MSEDRDNDKNPAEPASPEECLVVPAECWENAQREMAAQKSGDDSLAFTPHDEIDEAFRPSPLHTPLAEDGLPDHSKDPIGGRASPPPMTPETLVCLRDERPGKERKQCRYYKRQVFSDPNYPNPKQYGHTDVHRLCTARRSNGGAFMCLNDQAVYACDLRDPPDPRTSGYQDEVDRIVISQKRHLVMIPWPPGSGEEYVRDHDDFEDVWPTIIERKRSGQ